MAAEIWTVCVKSLGPGYIDSEISEEWVLKSNRLSPNQYQLYQIAKFGHIIPTVKRLFLVPANFV